MTRTALPTVLVVLVAGCELVTGVQEEVTVGAIGYPDHLQISAPDTVSVGDPFGVGVRSLGADGCWSKHRTEVGLADLSATVTPFDVRRTERGMVCHTAVVQIEHTATLVFHQPGTAVVEFRGRDGAAERVIVVR